MKTIRRCKRSRLRNAEKSASGPVVDAGSLLALRPAMARSSADAGAHEVLHELALEQQARNQQRRRRQQCRGGDDRPVKRMHALTGGGGARNLNKMKT